MLCTLGYIVLSSYFFVPSVSAQKIESAFKPKVLTGVGYGLEAGAFVSSANSNPFWLRSNQFGEVPLESQVFTLRASAHKDFDTQIRNNKNKKKLRYAYGARAVINVGKANQFLFSELYGKLRYGAFEFQVGRQREIIGLVDTSLSIGSYAWSGNALPMPKIQISMPNYTPILKNGLIAVKGNFAHGWFGSGDSTEHYFLHQKSIYLRLGKPAWRFKLYGGINHQVQWGGKPRVPFLQGGTNAFITQYGSGLDAFIYVATGIPLQSLGYYRGTNTVSGEGGNRLGNHLGTIDLAVEYDNNKTKWMLYRQSIYEDGSLFVLSNISDGLTGLSIDMKGNKQGVQKIVFEYLNTTNQGGPKQSGNQTASIPELRGADDYFNNATYEEGWTYRKQTIGTPFLMPLSASTGVGLSDFIGNFKPRELVNPDLIINNRVRVGALSMQSQIKKVVLLTRVSYSENLGKYYLGTRELLVPVSINQVSFQQQFTFPYKQYQVGASLAYDSQGILENNWGLNLLLKRKF